MEPVKTIISEDKKLKIEIYQDDMNESPREWDNLGKMICWHRDYNLGDKHDYKEPRDFYEAMATKYATPLLEDDGKYRDASQIAYYPWEELEDSELLAIIQSNVVLLPLYLYDHSGITMSTKPFSCRWDSGHVGWIYCTKERLISETGYTEAELFSMDKKRIPVVGERVKIATRKDWGQTVLIDDSHSIVPENMIHIDFDHEKALDFRKDENIIYTTIERITEVLSSRAVEILKDEVKTYDQYLTGDIYGYQCFKAVENIAEYDDEDDIIYTKLDSCWGFYGLEKDNGMADNMDEPFRALLLSNL